MALVERLAYQTTILEDGQLQVREDTIIERDGVEISRLYHRRVLAPLAPPTEDTHPDARVRAVAALIWTPEVIAAYRRRMAAIEAELANEGRLR